MMMMMTVKKMMKWFLLSLVILTSTTFQSQPGQLWHCQSFPLLPTTTTRTTTATTLTITKRQRRRRRRRHCRHPIMFLQQHDSEAEEEDDDDDFSNENVQNHQAIWYEDELYDNDEEEDDDDDDDIDDDRSCLPPGRRTGTKSVYMIFLVSDATGVTARSTLLKALVLFEDTCAEDAVASAASSSLDSDSLGATCDVQTRTFTFIRSMAALQQILETAKTKQACVMYTLADANLRKFAQTTCQAAGLHSVDIMGPPLEALTTFLERPPLGISSARTHQQQQQRQHHHHQHRRTLGDAYYQRMDALEFCLQADDGKSPWLLPEADIVLVGVSRSGKTPLSVVLAQTMSLKIANIPLVLEVPAPLALLQDVDPRRVFCLTIAPAQLRQIRTTRLERRNIRAVEAIHQSANTNRNSNTRQIPNSTPQSTYADRNYLLKDLQNARTLAQTHNWTEIDVTGRAVEETATVIVELFNERFAQQISSNALH
eukprot:scaffold1374_cov175-Amphora_coffeaeformis.AAC.13